MRARRHGAARADGPDGIDITAFERAELARIGMPREIVMRHRLPHFGHLFSGSGYAAGYYVYMWAEVLDGDAFDAFVEAGDLFDRRGASGCAATSIRRAARCAGGAFRSFRGRDPASSRCSPSAGSSKPRQPA